MGGGLSPLQHHLRSSRGRGEGQEDGSLGFGVRAAVGVEMEGALERGLGAGLCPAHKIAA